jgi:hypothetical protein
MNQSACSMLCAALNQILQIDGRSMAEPFRILESQSAVFSDIGARTLANDVCYDFKQLVIKVCSQICRI